MSKYNLKDYLNKIYQEDIAAAAAETGLDFIPGAKFAWEVAKELVAREAANKAAGVSSGGIFSGSDSGYKGSSSRSKTGDSKTKKDPQKKKTKAELTSLEKKIKLNNNTAIIGNNLTYMRYILIAYISSVSGNYINETDATIMFEQLSNNQFYTIIDGRYDNTQKAISGIKINNQTADSDNFFGMLNEILGNRDVIEKAIAQYLSTKTIISANDVNNIFEKYYSTFSIEYKMTKG